MVHSRAFVSVVYRPRSDFLCCHSNIHSLYVSLTYQDAGVELVEALHGAVAEAVTQVLLHKIGMVEDVISHERLLIYIKK